MNVDWQEDAACKRYPTEWWFRPESQLPDPYTEAARNICAGCPVQAECLNHALANREQFGIWAGLDREQRRNERRRRNRRKVAA